jgi:hypothetical protein
MSHIFFLIIFFKVIILKPDWLLLFHSMKSKQKSCQNEPSSGRFDGPHTRADYGNVIMGSKFLLQNTSTA